MSKIKSTSEYKQLPLFSEPPMKTDGKSSQRDKDRAKEWYRNNLKRAKENRSRYYENHKQEKQDYDRRRRKKLKNEIAAKRAIYRSEHKDQIIIQKSRDYAANKDQYIAAKHRRRAMIKQVGGAYTVKDVQSIYANQQGKCVYCDCDIIGNYEIDHIVPIIHGGSNSPDNLALSCRKCNRSKGTKLLFTEWMPPNRRTVAK